MSASVSAHHAARPARPARPVRSAPTGRSRAVGTVAVAAVGLVVLLGVVRIGAFGREADAVVRITTVQNAANGTVDRLRVDDAYVVSRGTSSAVRVAIANQGTTPDRLVAVTTGAATGTGTGGGSDVTAPPAGRAARLTGPTALAAGAFVNLENGTPGIVLDGVRTVPGTFVTVTFRFDRAGPLTLDLPVVAQTA